MKCEICAAEVTELRRGRCWGCYNRWTETRPVGLGAQCSCCGERRRDSLKSVELLGAWMPLCFNCAGRAARLEPMPQTLAGIRAALHRDRRRAERRWGKKDTRVFQYDRRSSERREDQKDWTPIDDEMIVASGELAASLDQLAATLDEALERSGESGELTQIRDARA